MAKHEADQLQEGKQPPQRPNRKRNYQLESTDLEGRTLSPDLSSAPQSAKKQQSAKRSLSSRQAFSAGKPKSVPFKAKPKNPAIGDL